MFERNPGDTKRFIRKSCPTSFYETETIKPFVDFGDDEKNGSKNFFLINEKSD